MWMSRCKLQKVLQSQKVRGVTRCAGHIMGSALCSSVIFQCSKSWNGNGNGECSWGFQKLMRILESSLMHKELKGNPRLHKANALQGCMMRACQPGHHENSFSVHVHTVALNSYVRCGDCHSLALRPSGSPRPSIGPPQNTITLRRASPRFTSAMASLISSRG